MSAPPSRMDKHILAPLGAPCIVCAIVLCLRLPLSTAESVSLLMLLLLCVPYYGAACCFVLGWVCPASRRIASPLLRCSGLWFCTMLQAIEVPVGVVRDMASVFPGFTTNQWQLCHKPVAECLSTALYQLRTNRFVNAGPGPPTACPTARNRLSLAFETLPKFQSSSGKFSHPAPRPLTPRLAPLN